MDAIGNFDYGIEWAPVYLGGYDDLTYDPDLWELRTLDGTVMRVSETRGLVYVREPNGNELTIDRNGIHSSAGVGVDFTRDGQGRITAVRDPKGNYLRYGIDGRGDLATFTDREGATTAFSYDGDHRLTGITDALGVPVLNNSYDPATERLGETRDAYGQPTRFAHGFDDPDIPDNLSLVTDRLGNRTVYGFDGRGNVTQTTRYLKLPGGTERPITTTSQYGDNNNPDKPTAVTDALNQTTRFAYEANGYPARVTDALDNAVSVAYDAKGNPLTVTDALDNTTKKTYDAAGNLLTHTDAKGHVTTHSYLPGGLLSSLSESVTVSGVVRTSVRSFSFDTAGRLKTDTDPLGHTVTYDYDANGLPIAEVMPWTEVDVDALAASLGGGNRSPSFADAARLSASTPGVVRLARTEYVRDNEGRVVKTIRRDGSTVEGVYDANGRVKKSIDPAKRVTEYEYDLQGRRISVRSPDGTVSRTVYDAEGRVFRTVSPRGLIRENMYDSVGRVVAARTRDNNRTGADGQPLLLDETFTAYDDAGQVVESRDERGYATFYAYDAQGRTKTIRDALNNVTSYEYDAMGRQTEAVDALNQTTRFEYDELGQQWRTINALNQVSETYFDEVGNVVGATDAAGRRTELAYDGLNRLAKVTYPNATYGVTFTYDEVGKRIAQTDANGHTTAFAYDIMGRNTARRMPMGQRERMYYRPDGRMSERQDFNGHTTTYAYDEPTGRLLKTQGWSGDFVSYAYTPDGMIDGATRFASAVNGGTQTTGYDYDVRGRVERVRGPTGTIGYRYDIAGNIDRVSLPSATLGYEYDELNRLSALVHPGGARTSYTYNPVGNRQTKRLPGGIVTSYGYDAANRLTSVTHANNQGQVLASFVYTLDGSGRRQAVNEARRDPATLLLQGNTTSYSFDPLGRLTGESGGIAGTLSYTYDAVGNRLSKTTNGVSVGYTYNANDWMKSEGAKTFDYDANGNTVYADGQTLQYDWQDRLVGTQNGGNTVSFVYDADGNRIQKIANGQVTSYLPETVFAPYAQVAEEREGLTGRLTARYDLGIDLARVDRFVAGVATGDSSYFLHDGLGSTVALADGNGVLTDTYGYDTFGNPQHLSGGTANAFLFNGQQFDEETGLYYLRARYYAPGQGRFINHDPLLGDGGDPLSLHRYLYANADPANFTDPTGMFSVTEQIQTANIAPWAKIALHMVYGAVRGGIEGYIASAGRAAILEQSAEEISQAGSQGATWGAVFGATGGLLRGTSCGTQQLISEIGTGIAIATGAAAIVEDIQNFARTKQSKYALATSWDALWLASVLVQVKRTGCFTEDAQVSFYLDFSPTPFDGAIPQLVFAWQSGRTVSVMARNEETGSDEICRVTNAWERTVSDVVTVTFADKKTGQVVESLTGTLEHPFMTAKGWVEMGQLGVGTEVVTRAGPRLVVKSSTRIHHPSGVKVYNFTVDDDHTYFVSDKCQGILVHNAKKCGDLGEDIVIDDLKAKGFENIVQIQNDRGNGVDILAEMDGKVYAFEVKTSGTQYARALTKDQKDASGFVKDRLGRAIVTIQVLQSFPLPRYSLNQVDD